MTNENRHKQKHGYFVVLKSYTTFSGGDRAVGSQQHTERESQKPTEDMEVQETEQLEEVGEGGQGHSCDKEVRMKDVASSRTTRKINILPKNSWNVQFTSPCFSQVL